MTDAIAGRRRPSYYHGWNIVAICVLAQIAGLGLTLNCLSLFLHGWTDEFKVPISTLALGVTLFSLGAAITAPFIGHIVDRYPAKPIFAFSLVGLVVFHAAMTFVTAGWQIVALYALMLPFAIGLSASIPSQALVSRWFVRRVGLAMGLTAFGLAFSGVVFPPIIVAVLPELGWRGVWLAYAGIIAVLILPAALLVIRDRPAADDPFGYIVPHADAHAHKANLTVADIFRRRNFWVIVGVFVPIQCVSMTLYINLAPIVLSYGFTEAMAGGLLSLMSASALVAKLASGIAADRFGNRIPLILTALASTIGLAIVMLSGHHGLILSAGMIFVGISGGIWTLVASATAAEFGAAGFGRAFGMVCAFSPIGSLAPPIVAKLQETTGSYLYGLGGFTLLAVIGTIVAAMLRERPRTDHAPAGA